MNVKKIDGTCRRSSGDKVSKVETKYPVHKMNFQYVKMGQSKIHKKFK